MEDLALSIDRQNAEEWMRPIALATPGCRPDQPTGDTHSSEQRTQVFDQLSPANQPEVSFEDTIRRYVPDGSNIALSLEQRESSLWLVYEGGNALSSNKKPDLNEIIAPFSSIGESINPSILGIEDINLEWCKALCARYP